MYSKDVILQEKDFMGYSTLYKQHLLDHFKHPKNKGILENPDISSGVYNPACGDKVVIQAKLKGDILETVVFEAQGCVISCAAASLLTDYAIGKTVQEASAFTKDIMLDLLKIELGPTRLRCALLALEALHKAIQTSDEKGQTCCTE